MSDIDDEDSEGGFLRRNRTLIIVAVVGLVGGGVAWKMHKPSSRQAAPERIVMISPLPPPPPKPIPTPPPVQQPPPEQKVTEQKQSLEPDKAEAPKAEPPKNDEPPPSMGSNIKGSGDSFGLTGSGNGGFVGLGGKGNGGGNPYGRYKSQLQSRMTEVLKNNKQTRSTAYNAKIKLWLDSNGVITRVEPGDGDAALALKGHKMLDEVPQGMPMPISTQINSVRPPKP